MRDVGIHLMSYIQGEIGGRRENVYGIGVSC